MLLQRRKKMLSQLIWNPCHRAATAKILKHSKMSETEITEIARSCKGSPAVIGDPEFVKNALEQYKSI